MEVQNASNDLLKIIYFPKTDGVRGGETEFIETKFLNYKILWNVKVRNPTDEEKFYCEIDNFLDTKSNKTNNNREPVLRFRLTQMDAEVKFNNLSEMPCMILDSFSK